MVQGWDNSGNIVERYVKDPESYLMGKSVGENKGKFDGGMGKGKGVNKGHWTSAHGTGQLLIPKADVWDVGTGMAAGLWDLEVAEDDTTNTEAKADSDVADYDVAEDVAGMTVRIMPRITNAEKDAQFQENLRLRVKLGNKHVKMEQEAGYCEASESKDTSQGSAPPGVSLPEELPAAPPRPPPLPAPLRYGAACQVLSLTKDDIKDIQADTALLKLDTTFLRNQTGQILKMLKNQTALRATSSAEVVPLATHKAELEQSMVQELQFEGKLAIASRCVAVDAYMRGLQMGQSEAGRKYKMPGKDDNILIHLQLPESGTYGDLIRALEKNLIASPEVMANIAEFKAKKSEPPSASPVNKGASKAKK